MSGRDAIRHRRDSRACSLKIRDRGRIGGPRQVLPEFPQVIHAPGRPDQLTSRQRSQRRRAPLLQIPGRQMRIGQHHRGEEVTADERRPVGRPDAAAGVLGRIRGPAEVTQAVPELGSQFGLIEIPDPGRIILRPAPLELPHRLGQRPVASPGITQPRQRPRLHGVEMCRQGGRGDPGRARPGGTGQVGRLPEPAGVGGLMAHRVQDARPEQPVPARLGQRQRLDEIPLRQRAARRAVVTHPCRQQRRLGHRREQRTANRPGVTAAEQAVPVAAEVLDQRLARVPTAEPVVELPEHLNRHPEPLDIPHAHPHAPGQVGLRRADRIDQPAQRRIIPRARLNPAPHQHTLIGQVGPPQRGDVPGSLARACPGNPS